MLPILTIVQDFADKFALPFPSAIIGSQDKGVRQYRALIQEIARDLSQYRFQSQTLTASWLSTATSDQGKLTTLYGPGYDSIVPDTLWDQTRRMRINGPVSSATWAAFQSIPFAGPEYQCYISNGHLFVAPTLKAGDTIAGIYQTRYLFLAVDGVTTKERMTADTDTFLIPDIVVSYALEYKWRKQKQDPLWTDTYNDYMGHLAKNLVKDGAAAVTLDRPTRSPRPGIVIPSGTWNV